MRFLGMLFMLAGTSFIAGSEDQVIELSGVLLIVVGTWALFRKASSAEL